MDTDILFVSQLNKPDAICGVGILGNLIADTLAKSKKYNVIKLLTEDPNEVVEHYNKYKPSIVLYNFNRVSAPWMMDQTWRKHIKAIEAIVYHEYDVQVNFDPADWYNFKYAIVHDPLAKENGRLFSVQRLMPPYSPSKPFQKPSIPTIGFQGQMVACKGLDAVVKQVQSEFDHALIRVHAPDFRFGEGSEEYQKNLKAMYDAIHKPGIKIDYMTDIKTDQEIVDFLSENTINCYFYWYNAGCGLASSLDFALAAKRPFAITQSFMFRHFWDLEPSNLIHKNSLRQIISFGLEPYKKFYEDYTEENVIAGYERAFDTMISKRVSFSSSQFLI